MSVRKLSVMLFLITGLQLLLGAVLLIGLQLDIIEFSETLLVLSFGLVFFSSLLLLAGIVLLLHFQQSSYRENLKYLEDLNIKLREQRHDYLNQIQIVYGLLELDEYESAREYLRPVFKDIMKVNRALRTAHPAVNALLQAKMDEAEQQQIDFYVEISTQLKNLPMEPWEFCKILANLIDNAITAAGSQNNRIGTSEEGAASTENIEKFAEAWIRLRIEEKPDHYHILIENNGPEIPKQYQKLIFTRGFTTKKEEGHGQGLAIVSSLIKEAGGTILLDSSSEETSFSLEIPKREVLSVKQKKTTG